MLPSGISRGRHELTPPTDPMLDRVRYEPRTPAGQAQEHPENPRPLAVSSTLHLFERGFVRRSVIHPFPWALAGLSARISEEGFQGGHSYCTKPLAPIHFRASAASSHQSSAAARGCRASGRVEGPPSRLEIPDRLPTGHTARAGHRRRGGCIRRQPRSDCSATSLQLLFGCSPSPRLLAVRGA